MIKTLTAVTAGVAGKIVLGAAVAAASVGGLHAADVVDVPGLPDQADEQVVTATQESSADEGEGSDIQEGQEVGDLENGSEEESEFSLAMQEWSSCVDEASAAHDLEMEGHDASVDGPPGRFDPEEACGDRPSNPAANGEQGPPEEIEAYVAAMQGWTECVQQNAPDHGSCERPTPPGGSQAPEGAGEGGPPEGSPSGPPEGASDGPPEGTSDGSPEDTPSGPPEGASDGPPEGASDAQAEGAPSGPPEGASDGPPEGTPSGPSEDAPAG